MNGDRSNLPRSRAEGYTAINTTDGLPVTIDLPEPPRLEPRRFNWNLFLDVFSVIFFFLLLLYCGTEVYIHRNDQVHKHQFVIDSIVTSPYNTPKNNRILSAWNMTFNVTNKSNSSTFFYENAAMSVFYGNQIVWATMLPNFYQNVGDHNSLEMAMVSSSAADGAYFSNGYVFDNRRMNMGFDMKFIATVTEHPKVLSQHTYQVVVICPGIKMEPDTSNKVLRFAGAPRQCEVLI